MQRLFLGIDQSFTSCGICMINENADIVMHETINTSDKDGDVFDRALKIIERIEEIILEHRPMRMGLEGLAFSKFGNATRDLAGLQSSIITHLRYRKPNHCTDFQIVSPNLLKKYATGSGAADKDKMYDAVSDSVKEVFKGYKKTKGRSDVVDAYWIARYILDIYNKKYQTNQTIVPQTN